MAEHTTQEGAPPPPRRPTIIRAGATPSSTTDSKSTLENGDVPASSVSPPPSHPSSISPPPRPASISQPLAGAPPPRPASITQPPQQASISPPPRPASITQPQQASTPPPRPVSITQPPLRPASILQPSQPAVPPPPVLPKPDTGPDGPTDEYPIPTPPRPATTQPPPKPPPPSSTPKASPSTSPLKGGRPEITIISARPMSEVTNHSAPPSSGMPPKSETVPPPLPSNRPKLEGPGRPPPPAPGRPVTSPTAAEMSMKESSANTNDNQAGGSGRASASSSGRASPATGPTPPPIPSNRPSGRYVPPPVPANRPSRPYVPPTSAATPPPRPSSVPISSGSSESPTPPTSEAAVEKRATPPPGAVTSVGPPLPQRPKVIPEHQELSKVPPPVPPMPAGRAQSDSAGDKGTAAKAPSPSPAPTISPKPTDLQAQPPPTQDPGQSRKQKSPSPVTASHSVSPPPVATKPSSFHPPIAQKPQSPPPAGGISATHPPVAAKPSVAATTVETRMSSGLPVIATKPAVTAKPPLAAKPDGLSGASHHPPVRSQTPPQHISASSAGGMFGVTLRPTIGPEVEETVKSSTQSENKTGATAAPMSTKQQQQRPSTVSPTQAAFVSHKQPDPFSSQKQPDPFSSQKQPDPFSSQKQPDPFSSQKQPDPFSSQKQPDPFSQPKPDPFFTQNNADPFSTQNQPDPFQKQANDPFASQPKREDPFASVQDPFAPSKSQSDPFFSQAQPDPFSPKDSQQNTFGSWPPPDSKTASSSSLQSSTHAPPTTGVAPPPVPASRPRPKSTASTGSLNAAQIMAPPVPSSRPVKADQTAAAWPPTPAPRPGSQTGMGQNTTGAPQDMSTFIKEIQGLYAKPPSPQTTEQPTVDASSGVAAPAPKPLPPPSTSGSTTARPTIIRPSKTTTKAAPPPPRPSGGPKMTSTSTAASLLDMPIPGTIDQQPPTIKKSSSASNIGRSQSMRVAPARPSQPKKKAPAPPRPTPMTKGAAAKPGRPAPTRSEAAGGARSKGAPALPQRPGPGHPLFKYMVTDPHAIAVFPYSKQNYDELSFEQDDVIILLKKIDDDWMFGRNVDQEGMFPKKFVRIIQALPGDRPGRVEGPCAVASYDYDSSAPDDLNFYKGDMIKLLSRVGDDWYKGECCGEVGMFPSNFVEVLEDLPEEKEEVKPDTMSGPRCRARFDFEAEGENDLDFDEGDIIRMIEPVGEEWMRGELNGRVGIFPLEFVEVIENLPPSSFATATDFASPTAAITVTPPTPVSEDNMATALYDFDGADSTELTFKAGDEIKVTNQVNNEWLVGEVNWRSGRFPANFIDRIPSNLPPVVDDVSTQQEPSGPHCIAVYDYDGTPPDDLSFKEGDKIMLTERVGDDWYKGTCNGQTGIFPKGFVNVVEDLPTDTDSRRSTRQRGGSFEELMPKAEALYDFTGESEGDLSFQAGDTIYLLTKVNDDWYTGEVNNKTGQFPAAFVEIIIPLPGPGGL